MYSSDMNVYVVRLRKHGQPLNLPVIRDLLDVPKEARLEGHWEFGSVHGERGRSMYLRTYASAPGAGVQLKLYQPTLAKIEHSFMKYRGYEPDGDGVHMQEWLVFPKESSSGSF